MHINDFYIVSEKLIEFIETNNLIRQYDNLKEYFSIASRQSASNFQQQIQATIKEINNIQESLEAYSFTRSQYQIIQSFNEDRILGKAATSNLQQQLSGSIGSYSSSIAVADNFSLHVKNLLLTLKILKNNIKPFLNTKLLNIPENEDSITIIFKNGVDVRQLNSLQNQAKQWKLIFQGLQCVETYGDFEIISFEDGSCKITIKNARDGILAIGALVTFCLSNYNTYLDIQIKTHEIEQIKNQAKNINSSEQKIKLSEEDYNLISENVATKFLHEKGMPMNSDKYEECHTKISKSSFLILNFIDKGGEVEFSEEAKKDSLISQIPNYFEKINSNKLINGQEIFLLPEVIDNDIE